MTTPPIVLEHVVIVGASLGGLSAARSLRAEGYTGRITVIGAEEHVPYDRPPLSKQYLGVDTAGPTDLGSADVDVEWRLGTAATGLDPVGQIVELADGTRVPYDGLVIATGAHARTLPAYDLPGVHSIRTLDDATAFRAALSGDSPRVALIGAGFIGAEVASSCIERGIPVTLVERADVPFAQTLGPAVGAELSELYRRRGVDLRAGREVTRLLGDDRVTGLELDDGSVVEADVVVVSVGAVPGTDWLEASGLTLDDGVVCDETLTAAPGVVAVGDVARWPNTRLGENRRVEHWEHAVTSGEHAARTLLGKKEAYDIVPWLWSDQFGFKLQLVGSTLDHDEVLVISSLDLDGRLLALYCKGDRLIGACGIKRNKIVLGLRATVGEPGSWQRAVDLHGAGA